MQVVDLQNSQEFQALDVELLSIAPDPPEAWRDAGEQYGIDESTLVLSDAENVTANSYDVMRWQAATGEPGHTFILVDERGKIAWIKDYGALENGGIMYVAPEEIVRLVAPHVSEARAAE